MDTQFATEINKPPIVDGEHPISPEATPKFSRATVECAIQTYTGEVYGIVYYQDPETKEAVFLPLSLQPVEDEDAKALKKNLPFFNPENPILPDKERELRLYNLAMALLFSDAPIIALVDRTFNSQEPFNFPLLIIPDRYKVNVAVIGKALGGKTTFAQQIENLRLPNIKTSDIDPSRSLTLGYRGPKHPEMERFSINAIRETICKLTLALKEYIGIIDNGGHNEKPRDVTPTAIIALASELIILTGPPNADQDTIQQIISGNPGLFLFRFKNAIDLPPDTETSVQKTVDVLNSPKMQQFATHQRLQFALAIMELVTDPSYKTKILEALRLATPQIIEKYTQGLEPQLKADLEKIPNLLIFHPI